jgi:hypothetical protein
MEAHMTTLLYQSDSAAWDQYAAAALTGFLAKGDYSWTQATAKAAEAADQLLLERKARTDAANERQFGKPTYR